MNDDMIRRAYYIQGVLDYVRSEYETDNLPQTLTEELLQYLDECYSTMMCYPNASGKLVELFRTVEKSDAE